MTAWNSTSRSGASSPMDNGPCAILQHLNGPRTGRANPNQWSSTRSFMHLIKSPMEKIGSNSRTWETKIWTSRVMSSKMTSLTMQVSLLEALPSAKEEEDPSCQPTGTSTLSEMLSAGSLSALHLMKKSPSLILKAIWWTMPPGLMEMHPADFHGGASLTVRGSSQTMCSHPSNQMWRDPCLLPQRGIAVPAYKKSYLPSLVIYL
mmetsp:Transcript_856/g.5356  ORF Transcript_856/g.5356 Transcript_856/m.5356 type:complete len:205 (-) Transcript_856:1864-2478(-)